MSDANGSNLVLRVRTDAGTVSSPANFGSRLHDTRRISTQVLFRPSLVARVLRPASLAASAILFLSGATFGATPGHKQSQDVAEAARQERARKQEQQKSKKHVYTNDDLSRAKILTPEDQARIEAQKNECAKNNNCAPAEKSQDALDANSQKPGTSLGEVARQYQKQKQNQKQLDALKPKQSEPFHLPSAEPALASPILPARPAVRQPAAPAIRPGTSSHVMRRDPFARVPVQPARPEAETKTQPEVQPRVQPDVRDVGGVAKPGVALGFFADVRPTFAPSAPRKFPRGPKISSGRAPLSIWIEREQPAAPVVIDPLPAEREAAEPTRPRNLAPAKPLGPSPKILSGQPQPPALAKPAPPTAIQPSIPEVVAPAKPVAPSAAIRPTQPKAFATARPEAPAEAVRPVQPQQPAPNVISGSQTKTLSVKRGDSLWKLAEQNLGSGRHWPELASANPWISNPNQIPSGVELVLPVVSASPASGSGRKNAAATAKVHKGDTLWSLAKANLGRWSAWPCLAAANPEISNPDRIQEGQELSIPSSCTGAARGSLLPDEK